MPGIPTHFKILELAIENLESSADPQLQQIGSIMSTNANYAYLGAIGPNIADFMPASFDPETDERENQYFYLWRQMLGLVGDGLIAEKGLYSILSQTRAFFAAINPVAAAQDLSALKDLEDDAAAVLEAAEALDVLLANLTEDFTLDIASTIMAGVIPSTTVNPGNSVPTSEAWQRRDLLFWKKTGDFTKKLYENARDSGDDKLLAYAYGYIVSYIGNTIGNTFINSIVHSNYRLHWWRSRWIKLFVDAWVHGYYNGNATIDVNTDIPNPPYSDWPALCDANLQEKISFGGPDPQKMMERMWSNEGFETVLDEDFSAFWVNTYNEVYGPHEFVSEASLNGAYSMTWLVLWFQTHVVGCSPTIPMQPPPDCGENPERPSWVDPNILGDNGEGESIPEVDIELDPDEAKVASGIILLLLGLLSFLTGGWIAGATAIGAGIGVIIAGATDDINWEKLRCDLYWYQMYVDNAVQQFHDLLLTIGMIQPYPRELDAAGLGIDFSAMGIELPVRFDSGVNTTKSKIDLAFPILALIPSDNLFDLLNFGKYANPPTGKVEEPPTTPYLVTAYPNHFISENNPLSNGRILDPPPPPIHERKFREYRKQRPGCISEFRRGVPELQPGRRSKSRIFDLGI